MNSDLYEKSLLNAFLKFLSSIEERGYQEGYSDGKEAGYDEGHNDGYHEAETTYFDSPTHVLGNFKD